MDEGTVCAAFSWELRIVFVQEVAVLLLQCHFVPGNTLPQVVDEIHSELPVIKGATKQWLINRLFAAPSEARPPACLREFRKIDNNSQSTED
jgi:hypothetical protein